MTERENRGHRMTGKSNWIYGGWYFYLLGKWWVIE